MKNRAYIAMLAAGAVAALGIPAAQADVFTENSWHAVAKSTSNQSVRATMRKAGVHFHATAKAKSIRSADRSLPSYPRRGYEPTD